MGLIEAVRTHKISKIISKKPDPKTDQIVQNKKMVELPYLDHIKLWKLDTNVRISHQPISWYVMCVSKTEKHRIPCLSQNFGLFGILLLIWLTQMPACLFDYLLRLGLEPTTFYSQTLVQNLALELRTLEVPASVFSWHLSNSLPIQILLSLFLKLPVLC